jgi:hypothetical protein
MWKNMVETDRPQMTINHAPCALYAGKLSLFLSDQFYLLIVDVKGYYNIR